MRMDRTSEVMQNPAREFYEFGPFRLDTLKRRLLRDEQVIPLTPKAFEILSVLLQSGGNLVEKDQLMRQVWPDTFVEEGNLSVHIFALRKALGENGEGQSYIETLPKLGYRFVGSVQEIAPNDAELVVERHRLSRVVVEEEVESGSDRVIPAEPLTLAPKDQTTHAAFWRRRSILIIIGLAIGAAFFGYWWRSSQLKPPASSAEVRSLAVLPFKTLGAEAGDQYLGVSLADALITQFGRTQQIIVRPTSTVLKYAENERDPLLVGKTLDVEAVLDGNVQRAGERIRVTVRLLRVSDGVSLWAEKFDERLTDIFALQDSISLRVAQALKVGDGERLKKRYTEDPEAYQAYLKGRYFWHKRTDEETRKALAYFREAIDKDPLYALAYSGLAEAYTTSSYYSGVLPRDAFPKAKAAAERALEIDSTLPEALSTLAYVRFIYDWDFEGSDRDFKRALELNPNYATARFWHGECLIYRGRFEEGIAEIKRAQELDPLSPVFGANLGWAYHMARQYDRAIEQIQKVLEMDGDFPMAYFYLGMAYEQKGMFEKSIAAYKRSTELTGGYPGRLGLGHAYAMSGRPQEAEKILDELEQQVRAGKRVRPTSFAIIYAALNDRDKAFEWLEKAYEERYEGVLYLKYQPYYDNLRSDPRYLDLLRRIGLNS